MNVAATRPHFPYERVHEARSRAITQEHAARGEWGDDRILRKESLAYALKRSGKGREAKVTLHCREYIPIWAWDASASGWLPVMPWQDERKPRSAPGDPRNADLVRLAPPVEAPMDFFYNDGGLLPATQGRRPRGIRNIQPDRIAAHVAMRLSALGLPTPDWFEHPCPPDLIAGKSLAERIESYQPPDRIDGYSPEFVARMKDDLPGDPCALDHAFARSRPVEWIEWIRKLPDSEDPRGDFIRDTRSECEGVRQVTPRLAVCIHSAMQRGGSQARDEMDALLAEFRTARSAEFNAWIESY